MIELPTSGTSCAELHEIADALVMIWALIAAIAFVKLLWWIAKPSDCSTSSVTSNSESEGYGHSFVWRGYEAQEAYREKHWGSCRELRRAQEARREDEIRRDEREKTRGH